jgi:hypothetical protein
MSCLKARPTKLETFSAASLAATFVDFDEGVLTPEPSGAEESVCELQIVATNYVKHNIYLQYIVVTANKNQVLTQTLKPPHCRRPMSELNVRPTNRRRHL